MDNPFSKYFSAGLPKWPALLVIGQPVTKQQAAEIILRTDAHFPDFSYASNDHQTDREANLIFGLDHSHDFPPGIQFDHKQHWDKVGELKKVYKVLDLDYLKNAQIASSYIGGAHGWCHWSGMIMANSFNIGKWPSVEEVFKEWSIIAEAFPFLDLQCHLMSGESSETDLQPLVHFVVKGGQVSMIDPVPLPVMSVPLSKEAILSAVMFRREWSLNVEQLREAVIQVYGKVHTVSDVENLVNKE